MCESVCVHVCVCACLSFKCVKGVVNEQSTALCEVRSHDLQRRVCISTSCPAVQLPHTHTLYIMAKTCLKIEHVLKEDILSEKVLTTKVARIKDSSKIRADKVLLI